MKWFGRDKTRQKALAQFAKGKGLQYRELDDFGISKYFGDMKLFKNGSHKEGYHVIERKLEMFEHAGIMDYHYTVSTGKTTQKFKQSVYFRVSEALMLPAFVMFPERWYHKIGKWFGMQDINFIHYPEFSHYYLLQGAQPEFIEEFFDEESLIRHFTRYKGWSVEAVGRFFVMYHPNMLVSVSDLEQFLDIGDRLFELLHERNAELEERLSPNDAPPDDPVEV